MQLVIHPSVRAACPQLAVGVILATVAVAAEDVGLEQEIDARSAQLRTSLSVADIASLPEIKALRRAYHALGKDPTRYRGSQESLLRRILKGQSLYRINTVVDVNNLVSIECRHSIGTFDRARIDDAVALRVAAAGETYKGIGRDQLNLEGLPVYADARGPFGSPTSDAERAKITPATKHIMMVINAFSGPSGLAETVDRAVALLRRYAAAEAVETSILH
jgi:DNA/RNA-binding domain of Phe-tRNA-synthetase-like protein